MAEEMIAVFRATFGRWPLLDPGVAALDHLRWKISGPFTRIGSLQARVDGHIAYATTSWASWMRIGGRRWLRATIRHRRGPGLSGQAHLFEGGGAIAGGW